MQNWLCHHCLKRQAIRRAWGRGLCQKCASDSAIRALYPLAAPRRAERRNRRTNDRIAAAEAMLPGTDSGPSRAAPGSVERLACLIKRAEAGVELWNPKDTVDLR